MKKILEKLFNYEHLTQNEAYECMRMIASDTFSEIEIASLLTALKFHPIDLNEMIGFKQALMDLALPIKLESSSESIDVCGTGGDGKNTFNISTITAFVLANMGIKVIKHGNYGVSSICGSSNVLEELGIHFTIDENKLNRQLEKNNLCFLHAPLFHPSLKKIAPIRKKLGFRTVFNGMGPLVNPAQPKFQLTGTYSLELARLYNYVLKDQNKKYSIVHGLNGYDELTFDGTSRIFSNSSDFVIESAPTSNFEIDDSLHGGTTIKEAASICLSILSGKGTQTQNSVVAGNVALALQLYHPTKTYNELFFEAKERIESGDVIETLKNHCN